MIKRITKIICAVTALTFMFGTAAVAGCSNYYGATPLPGDVKADAEAVSNGGFAVEKGDYIYYINGVESGTAVNDYGVPVRGAVYRVSKQNLANGNYASADRVVSQIAYSANYNAGIFIYGDRIYYGTPSTGKNSEGVVQNSYLEMKSTKLDGTETMKGSYVTFPSTSYEYRFVEEDGTVYLLYVATSETLYDETSGVTNLHSYNTETGADTLLAYNVGSVTFDSENKSNPRVYYTMSVYDYSGSSNTAYNYNQLYTVTASATEDKFEGKLNSETVKGWNDDEEAGTVDRYINCGDLVLDGIGKGDYIENNIEKTPFNTADGVNEVYDGTNYLSYTYSVSQYADGTVYYTRTTKTNDSAYLFSLKDTDELKPIENNLENSFAILTDGSNAGSYKFVEVNGEKAVLYAEGNGGISINYIVDGKLSTEISDIPGEGHTYYPVVRSKAGSATILSVVDNFLYYSVSGGNGYTINRVDYTGTLEDYNRLSDGSDNGNYQAVKILDLDASSDWYLPEILDNYILFASTTTNMTSYNYVMVFDMNGEDGIISNADIRELNEQYEGIEEIITKTYGDTDKYPAETYANVQNALRYAFYNGDYEYLKELAERLNEALEDGADLVYSEQTFAEYDKFLTPAEDGVWSGYLAKKTVNGVEVYANNRDYYYCVLGEMSEDDKTAYGETLINAYLVAEAEEEEVGWYDGLSTVEKVFFIIGMCLIGALVIGGGVWLTIFLVNRNKKQPEERRRRIKVDTTDDKNIDVYNYDD